MDSMGRAIRPAYEGIETNRPLRCQQPGLAWCRAIRPAYEGIETKELNRRTASLIPRRAIRPAYEGIETPQDMFSSNVGLYFVARSAPPMRGLKLAMPWATL